MSRSNFAYILNYQNENQMTSSKHKTVTLKCASFDFYFFILNVYAKNSVEILY